MKKRFLLLIFAVMLMTALSSIHAAAKNFSLSSPDGRLALDITLDTDGALSYHIAKDGKDVVSDSRIGITTSRGSFTGGLVFADAEQRTIDERHPMKSGSYAEIENHANELVLRFENDYSVTFRAYNDGAAFRQTVGGSGALTVSAEQSTFALPKGSLTWSVTVDTDKNTYERNYTKQTIEDYPAKSYLPVLYHTPDGLWCLLTEADIYTTGYSGSMATYEAGVLGLTFARSQDSPVSAILPLSTPWRAIVVGNLSTMVENTMVDKLTELANGDFSFVKTGVAAWSWVTNGTTRQDEVALIKSYIDLAAEMGWEYYILDEGFQPHADNYTYSSRTYAGFYDWTPEIVAYANARGIKLIAWINRRAIDGADEVNFLEEVKAAGFAGIKADFFDSESTTAFIYYNRIVKKCAELGLVVNLHGTNKPTGERMTYPNIISKEAVYGDEHKAAIAAYTAAVPFLRGALGSGDYTPSLYPFPKSNTTVAHQAAIATLIECGMLSMASSPAEYLASPLYWYYYDLPTHWDDLHFIDGYPQEYAILARKSSNLWYVSAVTDKARSVTIPLDFLASGAYNIAVYADNADGSEGTAAYRTAQAGDVLSFDLLRGGAVILKIAPAASAPKKIDFASERIILGVNETKKLDYTVDKTAFPDLVWTSSDESVVRVANGRVTGVGKGSAVVTVRSAANAAVSDTLTVHVFGGIEVCARWQIGNPAAKAGWQTALDFADPYRITLPTHTGELGYSDAKMPYNVWLTDAPDGDFVATVKVTGAMTHNYNSASIGIYADNTSVVQMARRFHTGLAAKVNAVPSKLGSVGNVIDLMTHKPSGYTEKYVPDLQYAAPLWMRIERKGDRYFGAYSYDGETFTEMPSAIENENVSACEHLKIALACHVGGSETYVMDVKFEDLCINGEKIPFTESTAVSADDGLTLQDILCALEMLVGGEYSAAADVNRNGRNDLKDILHLLKAML